MDKLRAYIMASIKEYIEDDLENWNPPKIAQVITELAAIVTANLGGNIRKNLLTALDGFTRTYSAQVGVPIETNFAFPELDPSVDPECDPPWAPEDDFT